MSPDAPVLPPACQATLPVVAEFELPWPTVAVDLERLVAGRAPKTGVVLRSAVTGETAGTAASAAEPLRHSDRLRHIPPVDHGSDGGSDDEAPVRTSPGGGCKHGGLSYPLPPWLPPQDPSRVVALGFSM